MACSQLINLSSAEGTKLLNDVKTGVNGSCCQSTLIKIFTKQTSKSSCGLVSCALVLSANYLNKAAMSESPFTEQNMFNLPATTSVISEQQMNTHGNFLFLR